MSPGSWGLPTPLCPPGSARQDLLQHFIADIIFYGHIKSKLRWLYGAAPACGISALPAAASALLGAALTPQSLHWGHSWSHCTTCEGHDWCHTGVMAGPAAPHIRDVTGSNTHGGVQPVPTPVTLVPLGSSEGVSRERGKPPKQGDPAARAAREVVVLGWSCLDPAFVGP